MRKRKALLAVLLLLLQCNSTGSTQEESVAAVKNEDSRVGMVPVHQGLFIYGTTEEEFQLLVRSRTINFPGLEENLRKMFEIPPQTLALPLFYVDRFEVTNEEFWEFITATAYRPENGNDYLKHWQGRTKFPDWAATFPVVWVSQTDAQAYCEWNQKRLPTEEEWEKAARGDSGARFPWGDTPPTGETSNISTDRLEPVGNRPEDRSQYGAYDFAGNVSELTSSTIQGRFGKKVLIRGGCFRSGADESATFYRRAIRGPDERAEHIGFRCVAD